MAAVVVPHFHAGAKPQNLRVYWVNGAMYYALIALVLSTAHGQVHENILIVEMQHLPHMNHKYVQDRPRSGERHLYGQTFLSTSSKGFLFRDPEQRQIEHHN